MLKRGRELRGNRGMKYCLREADMHISGLPPCHCKGAHFIFIWLYLGKYLPLQSLH